MPRFHPLPTVTREAGRRVSALASRRPARSPFRAGCRQSPRPSVVDRASTAAAEISWKRAGRYVLGNGGALLVGLAVAFVALSLSGAGGTAATSLKITDFMSYFSALRLIVHGHGNQIYNFQAIRHIQAPLMRPLHMPQGFQPYYLYPPYFGVLIAPLGYLGFVPAYLVWLALNCTLFTVSLFALESYAGLSGRRALVYRAAAVCFLPVFATFLQGQVSVILLLLFTLVFFYVRAGRDWPAGALLALALIKPVYVFPVLLVFLLRRRWRLLSGFAVTAAILIVLPLPILGSSISTQYVHVLRVAAGWASDARLIGYGAQGNQSIAGFTDSLLPARYAALADSVIAALAVLGLMWVTLRSDTFDVAFGLAVLVGLLISPHVFIYDLALMWLPVSIIIRYRSRGPRHAGALIAVAYVFILAGYRLAFSAPVHLSVVALTALGVWLALAACRCRGYTGVQAYQPRQRA